VKLKSASQEIQLYDREGDHYIIMGYDSDGGKISSCQINDYWHFLCLLRIPFSVPEFCAKLSKKPGCAVASAAMSIFQSRFLKRFPLDRPGPRLGRNISDKSLV